MIFKEYVYINGEYQYRNSEISQFLSEDNKKLGYVIHKKQVKHHHYVAGITFAFESDGVEGDDVYTLISLDKAKMILRLELIKIKSEEKKAIEDYYNEMLISLMNA